MYIYNIRARLFLMCFYYNHTNCNLQINALSCVSLACLLVLELQTHTNLTLGTQQISTNKTEISARENTWYIVGHGRRDDKIAKMAPKTI